MSAHDDASILARSACCCDGRGFGMISHGRKEGRGNPVEFGNQRGQPPNRPAARQGVPMGPQALLVASRGGAER